MGKTDPTAARHRQQSMVILPFRSPGIRGKRQQPWYYRTFMLVNRHRWTRLLKTAHVVYRLSFADQGKQTMVFRFRFLYIYGKWIYIYIIYIHIHIHINIYIVRYAARTDRNGHKHSVSARLDAVFIEL